MFRERHLPLRATSSQACSSLWAFKDKYVVIFVLETFSVHHLPEHYMVWTTHFCQSCWLALSFPAKEKTKKKIWSWPWKAAISILKLKLPSAFWGPGGIFSKCSTIQDNSGSLGKSPVAYQKECFAEMGNPWQAWAVTTLTFCSSVWSSAERKGKRP